MKRSRIIKIFYKLNPQEYFASIIIPITPIYSNRATKPLKNILNILLTKPKLLNKKEEEIFQKISLSKDIKIKRNFNILIHDELFLITENHDIETGTIYSDTYLKDFNQKIKDFNIPFEIAHIIFNYEILLKSQEEKPVN